MYDRSFPDCKIYKSRNPISDCNYKQHRHRKYINQFRIHYLHDDHRNLEVLQLGQFLWPTASILKLADRTMVKPARVLDDIVVSVASW